MLKYVVPFLALGLSGCTATTGPRVATALAAHVLCSETFIAERSPDDIFDDYIARVRGVRLIAGGMRYNVDRDDRIVTVRFAGGFESRAAFAEGRGCTVLNDSSRPGPVVLDSAVVFERDPFGAPAGPIASGDPRIEAALDRAFAEPEDGPLQAVKAIVIVYDGRIIGERYADGYGPDTPMLSWSVAKSVINALVGVLVRQGRVRVEDPAPVLQWADPRDPRHNISLDQLLRHTSGQPFGSANSGFDRASQMLMLAPDTAGVAAEVRFNPDIGRWSYTDGNYAVLSGVLRDELGGDATSVARFAHEHLFAPLGMRTAVMEFDQADAPMGAAFVFASARDWARFGQLYLQDGAMEGTRILPEGWVEYSSRPTPQATLGYGAGFWTNRGNSDGAIRRRSWGAPEGSFFANGNFGQTVLIAPSSRLVIARFGFSQDDGRINMRRTSELAAAVEAALAGRE